MSRLLDSQVKAMVEQFTAENCRFESVTKWRNTLRSKRYERYCLVDLAKYCLKFNINPDELAAERIQQSKSDDPRVRSQAEDRILAYHKELIQKTPGKAISKRITLEWLKRKENSIVTSIMELDPSLNEDSVRRVLKKIL